MPRHNPLEDVIRALGGGQRGAAPANSNLVPGGGGPVPGPSPTPLGQRGGQGQLLALIMQLLQQNPELLEQLIQQGPRRQVPSRPQPNLGGPQQIGPI